MDNSPAIRIFLNRLPIVPVLALFATSCTSPPPPRTPVSGFSGGSGPEVLGVQYASVTGSDGYVTAEVFLVNKGSASVTFTNAVLDGTALLGEKDRASRLAADRFRLDIGGKKVAAPKPGENEIPLWSQSFPDSPLAPAMKADFMFG